MGAIRSGITRDGSWAWAAAGVVAVLTLAVAFSNGGYFPGTTALATIVAVGTFLVRFMVARRPLAGLTPGGLAAVGALILLCAWIVLSAGWSDEQARSLIELNRAIGYVAVFALLAGIRDGARSARLVLRLTALALGIVVVLGVLTRIAPGLVDVRTSRLNARLSWPLGYWNAFGLAAGLTALLGLHLSSDRREHLPVRIGGGAVVPFACVGLYLTLSRGAIAATAVGLVVLVVLRGVPALLALLAVAVPAAVATVTAYDADALVDVDLGSVLAHDQGADVVKVLLPATLVAALLTWLVVYAARRIGRPGWAATRRLRVVAAGLAAVLLVVALAAGGGGYVGDQWDKLTASGSDALSPSDRGRLQTVGTNGRTDQWRVALDTFSASPFHGSGAGTYELIWARERPIDINSRDAHSLYLETLAEFGLVGIVLLALGLLLPFVLLLRRLGADPVWSGAAALAATWLVHAGIDWDWEVPAVSLWAFALLGAATADRGWRLPLPWLARMVVGLLLLWVLLLPARVGLSQVELTRAAEDFRRGNCSGTITHALIASRRLDARPEPLALLSYCDVRQHRDALARRMARAALERDPQDWALRYSAGLVDGATGRDPRPQLRAALRANPREPRVVTALAAVNAAPRRAWPRLAKRAPLPLLAARRSTQR